MSSLKYNEERMRRMGMGTQKNKSKKEEPPSSYAVTSKYKEVKSVGKTIASSKKRVTWVVGVCAENHTVVLMDSISSGKKVLIVNGKTVLQSKIKNSQEVFAHMFSIDGFTMRVEKDPIRYGDNQYELYTNSMPFSKLKRSSVYDAGSPPPPPPSTAADPTELSITGKLRRDSELAKKRETERAEEANPNTAAGKAAKALAAARNPQKAQDQTAVAESPSEDFDLLSLGENSTTPATSASSSVGATSAAQATGGGFDGFVQDNHTALGPTATDNGASWEAFGDSTGPATAGPSTATVSDPLFNAANASPSMQQATPAESNPFDSFAIFEDPSPVSVHQKTTGLVQPQQQQKQVKMQTEQEQRQRIMAGFGTSQQQQQQQQQQKFGEVGFGMHQHSQQQPSFGNGFSAQEPVQQFGSGLSSQQQPGGGFVPPSQPQKSSNPFDF